MKKYVLCIVGCLFFMQSMNAQHKKDFKTLKDWGNTKMLDDYYNDADSLGRYISILDNDVLLPFKIFFDSCRKHYGQSAIRDAFKYHIESNIKAINSNIEEIQRCRFYRIKKIDSGVDRETSFLYYYTNKELNDYLGSLKTLAQEMKFIFGRNKNQDSIKMNVFDNANFLNAYYNMAQSRSLLLAAMDNLERYYLLGTVDDLIKTIADTVKTTSDNLGINLKKANDTIYKIDTLLLNPYVPLIKLSKNEKIIMAGNPQDKITTATNIILLYNKKNWWHGLLAGIAGGLVAGLLTAFAHKN